MLIDVLTLLTSKENLKKDSKFKLFVINLYFHHLKELF